MAATNWSLATISFNSGADGSGVEWWADVPMGWSTLTSTARVLDRGTADGSVIVGARVAHRSLLVSNAHVVAPSQAARWAAQNSLEALVEGLVTTGDDLSVVEPGGTKTLEVRYLSGFIVRVRSAVAFEFDLPLVAPSPTKT
jgi:hypothetical protein